MRFDHIGIPTTRRFEGEIPLPAIFAPPLHGR
jgi:hypothetical protein